MTPCHISLSHYQFDLTKAIPIQGAQVLLVELGASPLTQLRQKAEALAGAGVQMTKLHGFLYDSWSK